MSFKREGDDWSQLNVLKVSASVEGLEQLQRFSEDWTRSFVLLLWQQLWVRGKVRTTTGGSFFAIRSLFSYPVWLLFPISLPSIPPIPLILS
jgi:hypothetical protein